MQPGTLIALAVLALTAASAMAQSNVTIYGRFNVSVEDQKALGKNTTRLVNNSSRIGFKGTEDLGGSLKAGFVLEHGFNADTGTTSGAFWGRQSEVNLSGGSGMLRLGNFTSEAYYATADYISLRNHDTGTSADVLYAYLGRDVNKIAYRTPEFGGATLELATSLKETAAKGTYDIALNWGRGRWRWAPATRTTARPSSLPCALSTTRRRLPSAPMCSATTTPMPRATAPLSVFQAPTPWAAASSI